MASAPWAQRSPPVQARSLLAIPPRPSPSLHCLPSASTALPSLVGTRASPFSHTPFSAGLHAPGCNSCPAARSSCSDRANLRRPRCRSRGFALHGPRQLPCTVRAVGYKTSPTLRAAGAGPLLPSELAGCEMAVWAAGLPAPGGLGWGLWSGRPKFILPASCLQKAFLQDTMSPKRGPWTCRGWKLPSLRVNALRSLQLRGDGSRCGFAGDSASEIRPGEAGCVLSPPCS